MFSYPVPACWGTPAESLLIDSMGVRVSGSHRATGTPLVMSTTMHKWHTSASNRSDAMTNARGCAEH